MTGEPGHKEHTNSLTGEPGHKKRKKETTPRGPQCKIKIQCACDGCNKNISAKLPALIKHHKVHHNVSLSTGVVRELYKGKFMEDKKKK